MKTSILILIRGILLGLFFIPFGAIACDYLEDGCLGCSDDELTVCIDAIVENVCQASSYPDNCDVRRVYDDAESYIRSSTSHHLTRIHSMVRSTQRYQFH